MLLDELKARVAGIAAFEGRVEGSLELAALTRDDARPARCPCAFVIPLGFRARPPRNATGIYVQALDHHFAVLIVLEKTDDPTGAQSTDPLAGIEAAVIQQLAGHQLPSADDVMKLDSGQLVSNAGGFVFYQVQFSTTAHLRLPNQH